jgi:hypothetical protein
LQPVGLRGVAHEQQGADLAGLERPFHQGGLFDSLGLADLVGGIRIDPGEVEELG